MTSRKSILGATSFPLEERLTPATTIAISGKTMIVTPGNTDVVSVTFDENQSFGFYSVYVNNVEKFNAGPNQGVTNLIVKGTNAVDFTLNLTNLNIPRVTVFGAETRSNIRVTATGLIGMEFKFIAHPKDAAGRDLITLSPNSIVGNANFAMGKGTNELYLGGGGGLGNLTFTSGNGDDKVEVRGHVSIGGNAIFRMGDGANTIYDESFSSADSLTALGNLLYVGGNGTDDIRGASIPLDVGGNVNLSLGRGGSNNSVNFGSVQIDGNLTVVGGFNPDTVDIDGGTVKGNALFSLGAGRNYLDIGMNRTTFGRNLTAISGNEADQIYIDNIGVTGNVVLNAGGTDSIRQYVQLNGRVGDRSDISGKLAIIAIGGLNSGGNEVRLFNTNVSKALAVITGGGDDLISMDDCRITGLTSISMGDGTDQFLADTRGSNGFGFSMGGFCFFLSDLIVRGGNGADTVNLRDSSGNAVEVQGNIRLLGGGGVDTFLHNPSANTYVGLKFEDFEAGEQF